MAAAASAARPEGDLTGKEEEGGGEENWNLRACQMTSAEWPDKTMGKSQKVEYVLELPRMLKEMHHEGIGKWV